MFQKATLFFNDNSLEVAFQQQLKKCAKLMHEEEDADPEL